MGFPIKSTAVPSHYAILNRQGEIEFSIKNGTFNRPEQHAAFLHEHIGDAVINCVAGASKWVVRPLYLAAHKAVGGN